MHSLHGSAEQRSSPRNWGFVVSDYFKGTVFWHIVDNPEMLERRCSRRAVESHMLMLTSLQCRTWSLARMMLWSLSFTSTQQEDKSSLHSLAAWTGARTLKRANLGCEHLFQETRSGQGQGLGEQLHFGVTHACTCMCGVFTREEDEVSSGGGQRSPRREGRRIASRASVEPIRRG